MRLNKGVAKAIKRGLSKPLTYIIKVVSGFRVTESGSARIAESGEERITEN